MSSEQSRAKLQALQSAVDAASGPAYYKITFDIVYLARQSPKPQAFGNSYEVKSVEIVNIAVTSEETSSTGKLDPEDKPNSAMPVMGGGYYWDARRRCVVSSRVSSGGERRKEQEQRDKAALADRLRQLDKQKPPEPSAAPPSGPSPFPSPSAVPAPVEGTPDLLPGAPGDSPIAQAAKAVDAAEMYSRQMLDRGVALRGRLGTDNSPSASERSDFLVDEERWRVALKLLRTHLVSESRSEAVTHLDELLDRYGGKLAEIRGQLGG